MNIYHILFFLHYLYFKYNEDGTITVVGKEFIVTNAGVASHPSSTGMLAIANRICYTLGITDSETAITA